MQHRRRTSASAAGIKDLWRRMEKVKYNRDWSECKMFWESFSKKLINSCFFENRTITWASLHLHLSSFYHLQSTNYKCMRFSLKSHDLGWSSVMHCSTERIFCELVVVGNNRTTQWMAITMHGYCSSPLFPYSFHFNRIQNNANENNIFQEAVWNNGIWWQWWIGTIQYRIVSNCPIPSHGGALTLGKSGIFIYLSQENCKVYRRNKGNKL